MTSSTTSILQNNLGSIEWVAPVAAQKLHEAGNAKLILDVRTSQEWHKLHIEGALHIPLDDLPSSVDLLMEHSNSTIVIHCRTDVRSQQAAKYLAQFGFDNLLVMQGGVTQWERDRLPLVLGG